LKERTGKRFKLAVSLFSFPEEIETKLVARASLCTDTIHNQISKEEMQ
jgi:hypothetical protein